MQPALRTAVSRSRLVVGALALLALTAGPARADKCTGAKLKAIGKKEAGLLGCQAKVAATNDTSGLAPCALKVSDKFSAAFAKAGSCISDEITCENIADACATNVATAMTDTFPSKCEAAKRKAAGKVASGELGCYAKAAATGLAVDSGCLSKATGKFSAALSKAGTCPDGGSPQSLVQVDCVEPAVTTDSGGMVTAVCGTTVSTCPFLTKWGSLGTGDGQFGNPNGVAVDGSGNVYVTDYNNRIQKFTSSGTFLTTWGSLGSGDGQFQVPAGVAVDGSANVYVTDELNHRIQKFTSGGTFLLKWGSFGSGDGQFNSPWGVAVDGSANVYVVDQDNARIQKFTSSGTFLTTWGSLGSGDGQFQVPVGVAVDGSANVYVTDTGNNRIQKFTSSGTFLTTWGSLGTGDGQFAFPFGVAVDGSGNVYVADTGNHRIQKFTCP